MAIPSFIYGGNTGINSPEELARARMMAEALLGPQRPAQNVGEGLAVLGQAIRGRREMNAVNRASNAGAESAQSAIAKALGGAGTFPPAPAAGGGVASPNVAGALPSVDVSKAASGSVDPQMIYAGLKQRGLNDAQAFATLGNWKQESEFRPGAINPGEGAVGFTQWREGRKNSLENFAKATGRSANDPEAQMDFYVREAGIVPDKTGTVVVDPGGSAFAKATDIQGANRALKGFIRYGSPYDKGGEGTRLANALAYQKRFGSQDVAARAPQGQQVASLDPSVGMPPAPNPVAAALQLPQQGPVPQARPDIASALAPPQQPAPAQQAISAALAGPQAGQPAASTPAGQRVVQQMVDPQPMSGGAPLPMMGMPQQPAPPPQLQQPVSDPQQQVAQNLPVMAGGNADAIPKGQLPSVQDLMQAAQNPWLNEEQRGVVNMLLKRQMDAQDPNNQLDTEYKRAQIDALKAKPDQTPESVRALQMRAEAAGLKQGTKEYQDFMISGGTKGTNINVDTGTVPAGYQVVRDAEGRVLRYEPVPGGPADTSSTDAAKAENQATSSDVITGAADKIRTLAKDPGATGLVGAGASYLPNSPAAELYRQVDVLKSNATIENLNAMRAASKTGGALGNVTEGEGKMLAAKTGALDPKSPYFQSQLDDYERTLLRVVHGKVEGDRIFEQSKKADSQTGAPKPGTVEDGYRFKGGDPADQNNWEPAQ